MNCDYDVQFLPGQVIGYADTMSLPRFKDVGKDLWAIASATFEKPVIDINFEQKEMTTDNFYRGLFANFPNLQI